MFKGLGDIASMMKQAKEMQGRMAEMQENLTQLRITGSSGGGMVVIETNGKQDVLGCTIDQTLIDGGDREMLEDLIVSAMNDAVNKSRAAAAEAMQEAAGGLNLPGMDDAMSQLGLGPNGG
ncbi:MAG: YbaB/EbfC family nucleoid-associated protein [Planctomycetota bacterium]|jgi:DNA-binding YbaB/EbfC family protein